MTYMATPLRTHSLGVIKFTIFVDPSYYTLSLSEPFPSLEKKIFFLENTSILSFLPMNNLPLG